MQKSLKDYAVELYQAKNSPALLSDLQIELASQFSSLTEDYIILKISQADFWKLKDFDENGEVRKKPLSDKALEMKWLLTEDGRKYLKVKNGIKSMTVMLKAINSGLFHANTMTKNQY